MQADSVIEWSNAGRELIVFAANMLATGAVGFRFGVLRPAVTAAAPELSDDAGRRAAWLGLVGVVGQIGLFLFAMQGQAARKQLTMGGAIAAGGLQTTIQIVAILLMVIGFLLATRRVGAGWVMALVGAVALPLRGLVTGELSRIVNPVHLFAAGLWIGTLFVLVVAGIAIAFRRDLSGERRGRVVADMVNAFSPLALGAAALLVTFGVITATLHLKYWSAIWTTPYGWAFLVKLFFVAMVVALGAWNWRRVRPSLGQEAGAVTLRSSATRELVVAGCVLLATSILVSIPAPKKPGATPPAPAPGVVVTPAVP